MQDHVHASQIRRKVAYAYARIQSCAHSMCNVDNDRQVYELQTSRPEANWDARVDYYVSELIGFFRYSRVGTVLLTSVFDPFVFSLQS